MRNILFGIGLVAVSCACADIVGSSSDATINLHGCCTDTLNRLQDGLEAYYPLHGDFNDHSGNGHDITPEDEVVWTNDVTGTMSALHATGDRHYAIPSLGEHTNDFSLAVWCKPETNLTSNSYVIFPVHGEADDVTGVGIRCGTNGLEVVEHKGGYLEATRTYSVDIGNRWHHVAVSVDSYAVVKIYLDGGYIGTAADNGCQKRMHDGTTFAGGAYGDFLGGIGEVRYYTRALTDMDVAALYNISRITTFDDKNLTTHYAESIEPLTYSTQWESNAVDAVAEIAVNGKVVSSESGSGVYDWTPTRDGTYTLTHTVMTNGVQVGETLTATFVAEGFNPEPPVILPVSGTTFDTASLSVSMSCASEGATIHYTTNGMTPTLESPIYKRFKIYGKTTVKAIAFYEDGTPSEMAVTEYARGVCEDPVITPVDGTTFLHNDQEVSIAMGEEGTLRYTLDGSEPTTNSAVYTGPFTISESTVIKAKIFSGSFFDSQVITAKLTREWEQVATPIITAASSFTGSKTKISIACATEGATIRYTTNGNDPNSHSTKYTGPFEVTASCTVKAYAVLNDYTNSEIASWSIEKIWGIGDALNMPDSKFTTSGDAGWVRDTAVSHEGVESMRSGPITHNQKSILSGSVTGAGTLTFWWKASCEQDLDGEFEWDHVEFVTDGTTNKLDGVTDWQQVTCTFTSAGEHTFTWTYIKDDVEGEGEDCAWVDELVWTPTTVEPIPDLGENPTDVQVATAISGSTDTRLSQYVTNGVEYVAYRSWATNVQQMAGGLAGTKAVHDSPHAWLSYALDSAVLVTNAPVQGEMRIASFEKNSTTGKFDFLVAVDGITVGAKALPEKLATLFFVEGCGTVDGEYLSTNVSFEFGTPSDGKVLISAKPNDENATQFFIKAKMTP